MKMYTDFNEEVFKASVDDALHSVRRVLDINRSPRLNLAEDVDHNYNDKFKLANLTTNIVFQQLRLSIVIINK